MALTGISMTDYGMSDDEMKRLSFKYVWLKQGVSYFREAAVIETQDHAHKAGNGWEILVEEKDLRVYRRKLPGKGELYEYKCSGTYYDITPRNFVDAQVRQKKTFLFAFDQNVIELQCDVEYRRGWDTNVLELEVLADDPTNDTQVVRWVAKYPFPLNARVYIYIRRKIIDETRRKVIISSHAVNEEALPDKSKHVRVNNYSSSMIINAHKTFDDVSYCNFR